MWFRVSEASGHVCRIIAVLGVDMKQRCRGRGQGSHIPFKAHPLGPKLLLLGPISLTRTHTCPQHHLEARPSYTRAFGETFKMPHSTTLGACRASGEQHSVAGGQATVLLQPLLFLVLTW